MRLDLFIEHLSQMQHNHHSLSGRLRNLIDQSHRVKFQWRRLLSSSSKWDVMKTTALYSIKQLVHLLFCHQLPATRTVLSGPISLKPKMSPKTSLKTSPKTSPRTDTAILSIKAGATKWLKVTNNWYNRKWIKNEIPQKSLQVVEAEHSKSITTT